MSRRAGMVSKEVNGVLPSPLSAYKVCVLARVLCWLFCRLDQQPSWSPDTRAALQRSCTSSWPLTMHIIITVLVVVCAAGVARHCWADFANGSQVGRSYYPHLQRLISADDPVPLLTCVNNRHISFVPVISSRPVQWSLQ